MKDQQQNTQSKNIIRLPQTVAKTGLCRSTIYTLVSRGEFPQQIKLSPRTMGFLESEVDQWLADKAEARNQKGANMEGSSTTTAANRGSVKILHPYFTLTSTRGIAKLTRLAIWLSVVGGVHVN